MYVGLVLRNPSTGAILFTGTETARFSYGNVICDGGPYRESVVGDTEITLSDGSIKLAKDILKNDKILSWDSTKNKFAEGNIYDLASRDVDFVYVVVCDGKLLKVSDSHTFWTYGRKDEIPVQDLVAGKSKIYVKVGDTIELKLVDDVYKLDTNEKVYSFTVPDFRNYVSNGIISHNYPSGCFAETDTSYYTDPTTFTLEADLTGGASYQLSLRFTKYLTSYDTSADGFTSEAEAKFKVTSTTATIKRVSAGTVINGGGFQAVSSDDAYIRHMVTPTETGIGTYVKGGIQTDKQYHPSSVGSGMGYDVGGYPMVKGYGRWTMSNGTTGTPATPSVASIGGVITSLTVGSNQGRYTINYTLTTAAGGVSSQTPSVFLQGIRESTSDAECTFSYGKRFGSNTSTTVHTQDNNTDSLNNMDELSVLLVM